MEVYPTAGLKLWRLPHNRYKGRAHHEGLGELVNALISAGPWLDLADHKRVCRLSDHAFDAVVAGLLARAAARGLTETPEGAHSAAATEGRDQVLGTHKPPNLEQVAQPTEQPQLQWGTRMAYSARSPRMRWTMWATA
ncbi:MAG: hypothetical protein V7646_5599 [Pseudonocardia sp.]